ncbi:MAG: acetyl-CoA C-acyltransferase [Gammaproteobacteria bacterium]|nr:MAG: acetyl-CoA C-acyltransferase [Gammaproteobacteria bacterium]
MSRSVVVVSGVRTAVGTFGGSLAGKAPTELGAAMVTESLSRAGIDADRVGHVVFGHVINTEPRDMYLSRVSAIEGGLPHHVPALTLNRLCGSGLQAVISASQSILLGDTDVAIAGGAEVMSRGPHATQQFRTGLKMGDATMRDMMIGALHDPFANIHMGVTAENVAEKYGISREDQDALAVESHRRAAAAIEAGRFRDQIMPVDVSTRRETRSFDTDEHVRADASLEKMAGLKPVFKREGGTVTAGNASGINDGAAALVLMEEDVAKAAGKTPMARIAGYAHAGVDPNLMGIGPVPASEKLLDKLGVSVDDLDVIEANEAFASQALAVARGLGLDPAKVNPNGSGISLGHPIGATGAIIAIKALYELERIDGRYALVTMCIGGGQGIALLFERV